MPFEFATSSRIIFGAGTLQQLIPIAKETGTRALMVTGRSPSRSARAKGDLESRMVTVIPFSVPAEPTTDLISSGVQLARDERCQFVIGFGGGSVLDAAKAISALMTNEGELLDYLEVIGAGKPLRKPAAPCIAIPTTAGTGAEVTRNAVLASPAHRVKASLRGSAMLPKAAIIDPELTCDLPPALTASTGLDALTQLIEPYVSFRANPLTDSFCVEGLRRVSRSLRRAYENGHDRAAREDMALASLLGGLSLANAGLGAVHGFAAPLGGMFSAPHGAICAALLPHTMEVNIQALRRRQPDGPALERYAGVARILTGRSGATADEAVTWVRDLTASLKIPGLRSYGVTSEHFAGLVENAAKASSMKANPIPLTPAEMKEILERAQSGNGAHR